MFRGRLWPRGEAVEFRGFVIQNIYLMVVFHRGSRLLFFDRIDQAVGDVVYTRKVRCVMGGEILW